MEKVKVFLEISQNSQENTCAMAAFLIKLQASALRPKALLKKTLAQVFSCEFREISKSNFLQNTSRRLLLSLQSLPIFVISCILDVWQGSE